MQNSNFFDLFRTRRYAKNMRNVLNMPYRHRYIVNVISVIFIVILTAGNLSAQEVTGQVRDAQTRTALFGATVQVEGSNVVVLSNDRGEFTIQVPSALYSSGNWSLKVSFLGFKTEVISARSIRGSDLTVNLIPESIISDEIFVMGHRVDDSVPMTYSNVSSDDIDRMDSGRDIPFLVQQTPSVVSTSDGGAGIGYTGIRIRGVDDTRINVTINGIPLNDSESHGVFWVNMPDFASSVGSLQIQRGVGTSTNGPAAFGATLNLQTNALETQPYASFVTSYGSFNTTRNTIRVGTGLLENGWAFEGRLSSIQSDGFIDRASSDLNSWYVSASRYGSRDLLKVNVFSGRERTYQAWNGIPEARLRGDVEGMNHYASSHGLPGAERDRLLNSNSRTYNMFTYDNQIDRYRQTHYQLHYSYKLDDNWYLNSSLHYTRGIGYFEEFRANDRMSGYNVSEFIPIGFDQVRTDLIRRRWLDNHFYGVVLSTEYKADRWSLVAGGGYNEYDGDHYGEIIWTRNVPISARQRYYENNGFKTDFNMYAKLNYMITDRFSAFGDVQLRAMSYRFMGFSRAGENVEQDVNLTFFNPKAGFVYRIAEGQRAYISYSVANKEPVRREYTRSTPDTRPKHETLYDLEAGYRVDRMSWFAGANFYYMDYNNQLILTGQLNDVGAAIRTNVKDSYRVGLELEGGIQISNLLNWSGNLTLSSNRIPEFTEYVDDYDMGGQAEFNYSNTPIALSPDVVGSSMLRFGKKSFSADLNTKFVSRQYLDNSGLESRSIDPYLTNDLVFGYQFDNIAVLRRLTAQVHVINLLDVKYESNGYTYAWIAGGQENRFNFYYPQAGRHFMVRLAFDF
jgi:iron complex outermembrane receptor protein